MVGTSLAGVDAIITFSVLDSPDPQRGSSHLPRHIYNKFLKINYLQSVPYLFLYLPQHRILGKLARDPGI